MCNESSVLTILNCAIEFLCIQEINASHHRHPQPINLPDFNNSLYPHFNCIQILYRKCVSYTV